MNRFPKALLWRWSCYKAGVPKSETDCGFRSTHLYPLDLTSLDKFWTSHLYLPQVGTVCPLCGRRSCSCWGFHREIGRLRLLSDGAKCLEEGKAAGEAGREICWWRLSRNWRWGGTQPCSEIAVHRLLDPRNSKKNHKEQEWKGACFREVISGSEAS